ncbi:hypermethylated in cancer 1 protein-like [Scleropages formosus]|nr:hypermethylated in cancer 1 protein-like [Scleropages formosus]
MEVPSHARHLLLQLNSQRTKGFLCDVIIVVQNALFRAHKNILAASSHYLKSLVVHDNLINLDHEMVSPGVFRVILDYIYTGRLTEDNHESSAEPNLAAVLAAASYLQLLDLVALCRKKLKGDGRYHLHPPGRIAPYGKIGGEARYRTSTPVIQSYFPGGVVNTCLPHDLEELTAHSLPTQVGELYAPHPSSQGSQAHCTPQLALQPQPTLHTSASESGHSPFYGLDLSKKSPDSQSQHKSSHPNMPHALPGPDGNSGPGKDSDLPADAESEERAELLSKKLSQRHANSQLTARLPHLYRPRSFGQDSYAGPLSTDANAAGERGELDGVYRWVKDEPITSPLEDDEEDDEEDDDDDEEDEEDEVREVRRQEINHRPRQHFKKVQDKLGASGDDEKSGSASEETGSSEDRPSPTEAMERFRVAFEPESLGDNLYVCIPCDKGFPSSEQLNAHVEAHTEETNLDEGHAEELPFGQAGHKLARANDPSSPDGNGGKEDGRGADGLSYLESKLSPETQAIVVTRLGESLRPYRCTSCSKSYKDPATLRQHEKTHWLTRPYPCNICGKKFTQRGTMTRHMRSHLGLKPFACDACGMRFTRQYRLTEHMRIHSGEKPYECQVCGGKFAQQRNLISHMKMHGVSGAVGVDGRPREELPEGIHHLSRYAAERLGFSSERAAELLAQASQHLLADDKVLESLYPLSKLAVPHLGLLHNKMDVLRLPLAPPSAEAHAIGRYSPG